MIWVTPKARAKHLLLFNKPASDAQGTKIRTPTASISGIFTVEFYQGKNRFTGIGKINSNRQGKEYFKRGFPSHLNLIGKFHTMNSLVVTRNQWLILLSKIRCF